MLPAARADLRARQADVFGRLRANELLFFDATTHPLGVPEIAAAARTGPSGPMATVRATTVRN
jgi:hypothetical protein